jgi:hypothetical protein
MPNENSVIVPTEALMRPEAFHRGVLEVRAGIPANFDSYKDTNDAWSYERGRQWALLAPRSMALYRGNRINPAAVTLFSKAHDRGWITSEFHHDNE